MSGSKETYTRGITEMRYTIKADDQGALHMCRFGEPYRYAKNGEVAFWERIQALEAELAEAKRLLREAGLLK
ncbi:MAG: hypothetical protein PHT95_03205 [Candidatus Omnitrophica bacterium]|nr:hypothetical protein [Candidatus Omnitrophota bacterium]